MKIALTGNPNCGKSSLYNHLTGLRQKVGNYPGVTVDKKIGKLSADQILIDLPGLYDIIPQTPDEQVVLDQIFSKTEAPDGYVYVIDASQLKTGMVLFSQLADMGVPLILVINMIDQAKTNNIKVDIYRLQSRLGVPILTTNARTGAGIGDLKNAIINNKFAIPNAFVRSQYQDINSDPEINGYTEWVSKNIGYHQLFNSAATEKDNPLHDTVQSDLIKRQRLIEVIVKESVQSPDILPEQKQTLKIDKFLTHPIWGFLFFIAVLLVIFQAIYTWSSLPMDLMDSAFGKVSFWVKNNLPDNLLTNLLAEGIIPGIAGVLIFIPQIALLFFFISVLEGSGYMSRVVFMTDRIMKRFGLNGRSIVPLISGIACAIPAIMSTRTIENKRERLITLLVTPFMTCSARLPVYVIIIALMLPNAQSYMGFDTRALTLFGLYMIGVVAAFGTALILKLFLRTEASGGLIMEMPYYRLPYWKDVLLNIYEKVKAFVVEAGKIIFFISIVLWFLASFGPRDFKSQDDDISTIELSEAEASSQDLEESFAGIMGKWIEPVIEPLGYDWKIGISLITSFAAREVFVGTLATIYSIGDDFEDESIISRMREEVNPKTGGSRFDFATSFSLLLFYAFAMQCMSTVAVVKRETKGWKWPIIQFVFMTAFAYLSAWGAYQILS